MRNGKYVGIAVIAFVIFSLLAAPTAVAQTCTNSNVNHFTGDDRREFRISSNNLGALSGVSAAEAWRAAVFSAMTWNEQANTRPFVYGGQTARTDIPSSKSSCDSSGIDYSLVVVDTTTNSSNKASTAGRCSNSSGQATQFLIKIFQKTSTGANRSWETNGSTIDSTEFDLLQTMTHEFGHTFRLGHPGTGYGIMNSTTQGTNRQRDTYQWDIGCSNQTAGERDTRAYRRYATGGTLGSESTFLGSWATAKVSSGVTWTTGSVGWAAAAKFPTCLFWTLGHNTADSWCIPTSESNRHLIGSFTEATFREDSTQDRMFWVSYDEFPTNGSSGSSHRIRYRRSSNGFQSSNWGTLEECSSMSSFMTCSGSSAIQSGKAPSVAWDDYTNRSVFAWTNQNRTDTTASREVHVAVGYIPEYRIPTATSLGVQSSVTPGMACKAYQARGYDCLVAVVPQTDGMMNVQLHRFWSSTGSTRYEMQKDSSITTFSNHPTASRIAVWYHEQKWWLAVRTLYAGNQLVIFTSPDTVNWSWGPDGEAYSGYSDIGPSAASYWRGNNALVYTR